MNSPIKKFTVTKEEASFLLGRLEDGKISGAYLPAEYLSRLIQVVSAAKLRADVTYASDAIKNVFGILEDLLDAHSRQMMCESELPDSNRIEKIKAEIEKFIEDLGGNDDGPKRA